MSRVRKSEVFRLIPDDWLNPLPLERWFPAGEGGQRPLEVDLGCGKGRFVVARAQRHPGVNFLAIDRQLERLMKLDRKAVRLGLANLRWLRCDAYYAVSYLLPSESVTTCYIFFPDPWPKKRHARHRLFSPSFVEALHRILKPGGRVHVATDHLPYLEQIIEVVQADGRFAATAPFEPTEEERTDFELLFLGRVPIGRYSFEKADAVSRAPESRATPSPA